MAGTYGTAQTRKKRRQQGAMERAEQYSKLTVAEKVKEQYARGATGNNKQLKKLLAKESKG